MGSRRGAFAMLERVRSKHKRSRIVTPVAVPRRYKTHRTPRPAFLNLAPGSPMESVTTAHEAVPLEIALRSPAAQSGIPRLRGGRRASDDLSSATLPLVIDATQTVGRPVSVSRAMSEVYGLAGRLAPTSVTVTLTGETGTGKDVLAHLIHEQSPRAAEPFVVFDCGAVPPNLVESEL